MSDLGTARGKVVIDPSGAVTGFGTATKASESFTQKVKGAGKEARTVGLAIGGAGAVIAAGLGVAISKAADFEERISAIGAVTGATEKELESIRKKALQLGADTKFSALEAAFAIEELSKAGVSLDDIMNGAADAVVNLAAAGEIDLTEAASIASAALNTFGLKGKDMAHVADLIAGSANASAIDVHEFGESLKQSGAAAGLVGLSFDDLAVGITAMGKAGIKGSDAGTSLKTFLLNLQPTTAKQRDTMKDLGIITEEAGNRFFTAGGKLKSLSEISEILHSSTADLTDAQKTMALETIFGSDAIRAAAVITKEGAAGMDTLAASMAKVSSEEVAEKRMDNFKGSLEQLQGSLETVLIIIGTPFLKGLRDIADQLTNVTNAFANLSPKTQEMIGKGLAIAAVLLIAIGAITFLVGAIQSAVAAFTAIGAIIGLSAAALFFWVIVIAAVVAALVLLWQKNENFRNGVQAVWQYIQSTVIPIAKDLAARAVEIGKAFAHWFMEVAVPAIQSFIQKVVEVGTAIVQWFQNTGLPAIQAFIGFITGTVIPAIGRFASSVQEKLGAAFNWLQANVFPVFTELGALAVAVFDKIVQGIVILGPLWQAIWTVITTAVSIAIGIIVDIVTTFVGVLLNAWSLLGDNIIDIVMFAFNFIKSFVEIVLRTIQGIIQVVTGIITGDWAKAWDGVKNIFGAVWDFILLVVTGAIQAVGLIIGTGLDLIRLLWDTAWAFIGLVLRTAWSLIQGVVTGAIAIIIGLIGSALNLIRTIWNNAWSAVSSWVTGIWAAIVAVVSTFIGALIERIATALNNIRNAWNSAWSAIGSFLSSAWSAMTSRVSGAISTIIGFLQGVPGRALGALGGVVGALISRGAQLIAGFQSGVTNGVIAVVGYLSGLPGRIAGWIGNLASTLWGAGRDLIQGFVDGIRSVISSVRDTLTGLAGSLTSWKGPPAKDRKLFIPIGRMLIEGLIEGISDQVAPLRSLLQDIGPSLRADLSVGVAAAGVGAGGTIGNISPSNSVFGDQFRGKAEAKPTTLLHIENFTVQANTPEEGRAAGKAFLGVLEERKILTDARIV